jgi:hypothetical protein
MEKKGLSKICWGKVRRGERVFPLLLLLLLPLATELGSSFTSLLLLLFKTMNLDHWRLSFF